MTILNYKYLYILLFGCILLTTSCNKQLDKYPESQLSDPTFWKSANDLKLACNALYTSLPTIDANAYDNRTDNTYGRASNEISDGSRVAANSNAEWTNSYNAIRKANNIIEKSRTITDDSLSILRYVAEARFFRGFHLFELVKRFGDIPLTLRTFDANDTLAKAHRTNRKIVLDSALADLEFASHYLPKASTLDAKEYGRITSGAATAIKARLGLFEGTWSKYHMNDNANMQKYLDTAIAACKALMNENYYGLYVKQNNPDSSYFYLFQYDGEGPNNRENILVRLYGQDIDNSIASSTYTQQLDIGQASPTQNLIDAYLYNDGLPIEKSPLKQNQDSTMSQFTNRDPRLGMTVFNKRTWYISGYYLPTFNGTLTGYKPRKYFISSDYSQNVSYIDNIVIRYAEILLTYAEATYERNGSISDNDLNISVNLVKSRVNMPALTNNFISINGLDMLEEIRRERRIELAIESYSRYWDLIRWKTAETILPKAILGSKIFPEEQDSRYTPKNPPLSPDGYLVVQSSSVRKFNPEKDYLYPIPLSDIANNTNLEQNPNW